MDKHIKNIAKKYNRQLGRNCLIFSLQNNPYPPVPNFKEHSQEITASEPPASASPPGITFSEPVSDDHPHDNINEKQKITSARVLPSSQKMLFASINYDAIHQTNRVYIYLIDSLNNLQTKQIDFKESNISNPLSHFDDNQSFEHIVKIISKNNEHYFFCNDTLYTLDQQLQISVPFTNPYLKNCRDVALAGRRLFIASAGFDSILVFDLKTCRFTEGYHLKLNKTANIVYFAPFDPNTDNGPIPQNNFSPANLFIKNHCLFFSCLKYNHMFYVKENGALNFSTPIPINTHFVRSYKGGILIENSQENKIEYLNHNGDLIEEFLYPTGLPPSHLKQLAVTEKHSIVAAFSPSVLSVYQPGRTTPLKTADVTCDPIKKRPRQ